MAEPISAGAMVASALAGAAGAAVKGVLTDAAKDAYAKLKGLLAGWASHNVADVEAKPDSSAQQAALAEKVDARPTEERDELRALAEALAARLAEASAAPRIGTQTNVTAGDHGYAAGRDQYIGVPQPKRDAD
ncbi:MAG: hypothetical protein AAFX81_01075 [Pseudomonadota bacterium]